IVEESGVTNNSMEDDAGSGIRRVQWALRPDAPPSSGANAGQAAAAAAAAARFARRAAGTSSVPFVTATGGRSGPVEPGAYMVRISVAGETLHTSVQVLEDVWMHQ